MLSPTLTPCDFATSGLITTLTGLPPRSGSVYANVHCEPCGWACDWDCDWAGDWATASMQFPTTTRWILPVSKVTPGAAAYGLASVSPSLLPEGQSRTIATTVRRVRGTRTAARIKLAFLRAASARGVGSSRD